jgi:RNA polymerase sigma factor (sigma-70 family)
VSAMEAAIRRDAIFRRTMTGTDTSREAGQPVERPTLSAALEATVARFRRLIRAAGRRHGLSEADVDEVLQDVRIRLWRNRGDVGALAGLGASYVHRTTVSAAIDVLRRRRARRTGPDATEELSPGLPSPRTDPAGRAEQRELVERVHAAVGRLMPSRRPIVRMHLAGYDRREIAQSLSCSEGKVRNLLSRGLADLRRLLGDEGIGPGGMA